MASTACLVEIGQDLECSICTLTLEDPRVLLCQHVFCLKCLELMCKGRKVLICPICRVNVPITNGVRSLPKPLALNKVRETLTAFLQSPRITRTSRDVCVLCDDERKTTVFCQDCLEKMCRDCFDNHVTASGFEGHVSSDIKRYPSCTTHSSTLCKQYCTECLVPTCVKCVFGIHQGHTFKDVETAKDEEKQKLGHDLVTMETRMRELSLVAKEQSDLVDQTQTKYDVTIESLKDWTKNVTAKIILITENMIPVLEDRKRHILKNLEHKQRLLQEIRSQLVGQTQKMTSAMNGDDVDEILNTSKMTKECKTQLDKINSHLILDVNVECPSITLPYIDSEIDNIWSDCSIDLSGVSTSGIEESTRPHPSMSVSGSVGTLRSVTSRTSDSDHTESWSVNKTIDVRAKRIIDMICVTSENKVYLRVQRYDNETELMILNLQNQQIVQTCDLDVGLYGNQTGIAFDTNRQVLILGFYPKRLVIYTADGGQKITHHNIYHVKDISRMVYCRTLDSLAVTDTVGQEVHIINCQNYTRTRSFQTEISADENEPHKEAVFIDCDEDAGVFALSDRCQGQIVLTDLYGARLCYLTAPSIGDPSCISFSPSGILFGCTFNAVGDATCVWSVKPRSRHIVPRFCDVMDRVDVTPSLSAISAFSDDVIVAVGYPRKLIFANKQQ